MAKSKEGATVKMRLPEGKYMAVVKVGEKGQIVIPKEVRDMFQIKPGENLLLLADIDQGIAIGGLDGVAGFLGAEEDR